MPVDHADTIPRSPTEQGLFRHECSVFSCAVVMIAAAPPDTSFAEVEEWLRGLDARFSRFRDDNELAAVNASGGGWVPVSRDMTRLLDQSLRVAVASNGLVNIAVAGAMERAGYVDPWPAPWRPPDESGEPLPALTEVLEVRGDRARVSPGHRLDFGAIAKGLWADEAVDRLGPDAAVSLGGDVAARGPGPNGTGWPIGLPNGRTVTVRDGGVATSGTTKRRSDGAHHVIDPRTGRPATPAYAQVSALAGSASDAEWAATALLLGAAPAVVRERAGVRAVFTEPAHAGAGARDGGEDR